MISSRKKISSVIFFAAALPLLFFASGAYAANVAEYLDFNVDKNFDILERSQISTILIKTTPSLYFYIEKNWWDSQVKSKQEEISAILDNLSSEFSNKIYPTLTSVFGSEWKPGVDGDNKITILLHSMKDGVRGYFRSADEYIKLQSPESNEREIIYLSISHINDSQLKVFLSHEFLHLIIFNQKEKLHGVQEEIWLNEARAEYTSTVLGYDSSYGGSNLQRRIKDFLVNPSDSLTEWRETKYDYGIASAFIQYVIDQYGINILIDSLQSKLVGIPSINEALAKNGVKESFEQIFTNWTVAVTVNDCSHNQRYCYLSQNLRGLKINPTLNFLPISGNSSLSVINVIKNWSANWQKIIGGNGDLKLEFSSLVGLNFKIPYIIFDKENNYSVNFLNLDKDEKGQIEIKDFGLKFNSLIIIPSLQTKTSGFNGLEFTFPYTFIVSITGEFPQEDQILIQKLLAQIESLKQQISAIQWENSLNNLRQNQNSPIKPNGSLCLNLSNNLYFGMANNNDIRCLQRFLKNQVSDIYPEGLITGNFGNLTKAAVIRFQKKYGIFQTGFVGPITRAKINELLKP